MAHQRKVLIVSRTLIQHVVKVLIAFTISAQVAIVGAWPFERHRANTPVLHTTISADGKMVVALANAGTERQLLRVRKIPMDSTWRTVPVPPFTQTVRFASEGHSLLMTYHQPQYNRSVLARLDLDNPDSVPQKIFEAQHLAFPVEISPGRVMVRTRELPSTNDPSKRAPIGGYHWIVIGPGQQVANVGPSWVLPYPAPNIVGNGFFWTEEQMDAKKQAHPLVMSYPLPGGSAPVFARDRLDKNTWSVACDQTATRCLRKYITNRDQKPAATYIYDVDVLFGNERCKLLQDLAGAQDEVSVTPDGNAAIMSLAKGHTQPRHVVVMRFQLRQCEPVSVQHLYFEEK